MNFAIGKKFFCLNERTLAERAKKEKKLVWAGTKWLAANELIM